MKTNIQKAITFWQANTYVSPVRALHHRRQQAQVHGGVRRLLEFCWLEFYYFI
jgi:hypothetical protein